MRITHQNKTDSELIDLYRSSEDQVYLGELYNRYMHLVLGSCLKYASDESTAHDYVMLIYEKLIIDLLKHEVQHFKSWLFMVTRNLCLMELRKLKTRNKHEGAFGEESLHFMESEEAMHLKYEDPEQEALKYLNDCMETLKLEQKSCVQLFYIDDKCYDEVAKETGYLLKKVKSYIQNGKRNLKICMERKHAGEIK